MAPVSAGLGSIVETATDRPSGFVPRSQRGVDPAGGPRRIRCGIIGATGYVGAELIRILARHPNVDLVGLQGRERDHDPIAGIHPHLGPTGLTVHHELPPVDAVFLALPHGTAADLAPGAPRERDRDHRPGPDFRLRDAADYPRWYGFEHPHPELLEQAVYGLPELHRAALSALVDAPVAIVGAPGCYPDGDDPGARAAGSGGPDRRPRRRREERRLGRRPRGQGGPDVRRGQREREGLRARRPSPRRRDRTGARVRRADRRTGRVREPRVPRPSTSCRISSR